jgi:hypothetical protein
MRKLLVLAMLVLAGCGDDTTRPQIPGVEGQYVVTWDFVLRNPDTGQVAASGICPGSLTIASQNGGSFFGSYLINVAGDLCTALLSGNVSGAVSTDGRVDFGVDGVDFSAAGCAAPRVVVARYRGTIIDDQLIANRTLPVSCFISGRYFDLNLETSINGSR